MSRELGSSVGVSGRAPLRRPKRWAPGARAGYAGHMGRLSVRTGLTYEGDLHPDMETSDCFEFLLPFGDLPRPAGE